MEPVSPGSSSSTANSPTASSRGFANPTTRSPESRNAFMPHAGRHSRSEASRSPSRRSLVSSSRDLGWRGHPSSRRGSRRRRPAAFAGVVAAGTLIVGLLLGVRIDLAGNPAGADTGRDHRSRTGCSGSEDPAHPSRSRRQKPAGKPKPQPQRFAWAPVPDASAYHVELPRLVEGVRDGHGARRADHPAALDVRRPNAPSRAPGNTAGTWPVTSGRRAARGDRPGAADDSVVLTTRSANQDPGGPRHWREGIDAHG